MAKFDRVYIDIDRNVASGRIDFLTKGVAAMVEQQLAAQAVRRKAARQKQNRGDWKDTEFHPQVFKYDVAIKNVAVGADGGIEVQGQDGTVAVNVEVPKVLADSPGKAVVIEDKDGEQYVVQKDKATGQTTVAKVEGGGLVFGADGKIINDKELRKLDRMILASLKKYKKAIDDYLASNKQVNPKGKGSGPSLLGWELQMFQATLPQCLDEHKDKLNDINSNLVSLTDSTSSAFAGFASMVAESISAGDNAKQEEVDAKVCETLLTQDAPSKSLNAEAFINGLMNMKIGDKINGKEIAALDDALSPVSKILKSVTRVDGGLQINLTLLAKTALALLPKTPEVTNGAIISVTQEPWPDNVNTVLHLQSPDISIYYDNKLVSLNIYVNNNGFTMDKTAYPSYYPILRGKW